MEVSEVIDRLKELGGKSSLSSSEKAEVASLYYDVLGKKFVRTSCKDCYRDATIEMIAYLKKNGKMKEKSNYVLKNGVVLQPVFGSSQFYTNANLTDEVAENYLAANPSSSKLFSVLPPDWENRVSRRNLKSNVMDGELLDMIVESLNDGISEDSIKESLSDYLVGGRKLSEKMLKSYIDKAKVKMQNKK